MKVMLQLKSSAKHLLSGKKSSANQKSALISVYLLKTLVDAMDKFIAADLKAAFRIKAKQERNAALDAAEEKINSEFLPEGKEHSNLKANVQMAFKKLQAQYMRQMILDEKVRADGRATNQIRPIAVETGLLPRTHGSALFTRGETQALAVCTLGGETMAQRYEDLNGDKYRRFYLQYFFPPFSVGEVGRMGAPGRREIGHGKLAELLLTAILPAQEDFPYVIRFNLTFSSLTALHRWPRSAVDAWL